MEIIELNRGTGKNPGLAVALGYFDGLHLGHQALVSDVVEYAKNNGLISAVMTFSVNPKVYLKRQPDVGLLTPMKEKLAILRRLGVDRLMVLPFDMDMAQMLPEDFIQDYLVKQQVRYVATGPDYCFGNRGAGKVGLLKQYEELFLLNVTPKMKLQDEKIGTTEIKSYLEAGEVEAASNMLGRPYALTGTVIKGNQKGRTIGFPTANIQVDDTYVLPKSGVYAVETHIGSHRYLGMCNIGHNPTFNFTGRLSVEVNLFDFDEDIYGKTLRLEFKKYLRSERKFSSIEDLTQQLRRDRLMARVVFDELKVPKAEESMGKKN
ncbi:MAG: riboflavin biosynthesis protein RibF [Turicibacter sp.]|nr:riboflavin biosynthesis protein RibF [Turicibacter sp.]